MLVWALHLHVAVTFFDTFKIGVLQANPQLKQFVRAAVERAVQELLVPVVDRSIKIALTTCEQIIKKVSAHLYLTLLKRLFTDGFSHTYWYNKDGISLGTGRPKLTWKKLTEKDCREWKPTTVDPQVRSTWRSGVRSATHAASQLPERGPPMWMMHLHVNQKSDYDYDIIFLRGCML